MEELVKPGSLGFILLKSQIISEADIAAALQEQQRSGCRIGEALVRLNVVTQEDIDWALSNQLNIPFVRLKKEMIDSEAADLLPGFICRQYGVMPIIRCGNELSLAMIDPLNIDAISAVQELTGCSVTVSIALMRELREMQTVFYGPTESGETLGFASGFFPAEAVVKINADLTGARLTDYLIGYMVQQNLSSISIMPVADRCLVVARKRGARRELGSLPLSRLGPLQQRLRRMAGLEEGRSSGRGRIAFHYNGTKAEFQASFLQMAGGYCITLRRGLDKSFPASLGEFQTTESEMELLRQLLAAERGLVLFTAVDRADRNGIIDLCLDAVVANGRSVTLIGDGIGLRGGAFPRILPGSGETDDFSSLISALLEHEPDIIAIEDGADEQQLLAAFKAAAAGKLVLCGVPGGDLTGISVRLARLWRHHQFMPGSIKGVISCRPVQLLCSSCRQEYSPTAEEMATMALANPPARFHSASGCPDCGYSGLSHVRYLLDAVAITPGILQVMEKSAYGYEEARQWSSSGHSGVLAQGIELLQKGELSPQEFISALVL